MIPAAAHINLERSARGSGFRGHPAVIDNCMQLGPMIGALNDALAARDPSRPQPDKKTRVVGAMAGFHTFGMPQRGFAFAATEMQPQGPDEEIYTSHWIMGAAGNKTLTIRDLKVSQLA